MGGFSRRGFLGTGAAFVGLSLADWRGNGAWAADPLQVFGHKTHQTTATTGKGGDVTADWTSQNGTPVSWTTFDISPLQDRLLRELSLSQTSVDLGFVLNTQMTPQLASLFEPLGPYMTKDPVEAPEDIFPGFMTGMSVGGSLLAVPSRGAVNGFHYNEEILAKRGFPNPPKSIEEVAEIAKACTYRDNGVQTVGLAIPITYQALVQIARAWDGDFITGDLRCAVREPPMLNAVRMLADLYKAGAIPRNVTAMSTEDPITWMQTGRAAMYPGGLNRSVALNDPQKSLFPGKIKPIPVPVSETLKSRFEAAPGSMEIWGMAIPKNSRRKDLAWSFIKAMSTKDALRRMQLNGNGSVRRSTYGDPEVIAAVPFAEAARRTLENARVPLPAFNEAARAADLFKQQVELAVLGSKSPEQAMADAEAAITPLLRT
jgi:multiple sugar transport system substrate-binding protein